ncbi:hypothetical protein Ahy_B09g099952 isoform B [Arachis hypogaea]|uniref:Urease accessory protein F n=1 Tax=Arachis hypogaea TaxID=3818 RepID=A0A444XWC6_ARAHY|nr:hypothetical protein Ahy_B09g099952 isoform B [Arachis hypogaea]
MNLSNLPSVALRLPSSSGRPCFFLLQESQLLLPRARRVSPWYSSTPSRSCRRPSRAQVPSSSSGRRMFFQPPPSSESCSSPGLCLRRASAPLLRLLRRKTLLHSNFLPSSSENRSSTKKKTLDFEGCDNGPRLAASIAQWSQWQLLDSLLPTGGFAHSFGLEAAVQSNLVSNPDELKTFIIHVLENTGSLLLPFVHVASVSPKLETWHNLDKILDATLTNEVSRKASISQGSALMRVGSAVFSELPSLKTMRNASLGSGTVSFHHAPIFGLICGTLGLDSTDSQRAYMYITMRDVISAATRLNLIGPLGAAVLQHQLAPNAEGILEKWKNRNIDDACQVAPLLDTVQGCHDISYKKT